MMLRKVTVISILMMLLTTPSFAQAPIVKPGAPGQDSQFLDADEASRLTGASFTAADLRFMRDMIPHHQQALDMSALVADRTGQNAIVDLARRIETSQRDEIEFMENWLAARGQPKPDRSWAHHVGGMHHAPADHSQHSNESDHSGHMGQAQPNQPVESEHIMEGMATLAEMKQLEDSQGQAFDRLFLRLMITHHQGALTMVEDLLDTQGSARDPAFYEFVSDVQNDQEAEIDRMFAMVNDLVDDPRVGLAAGFQDAESAISNLTLLTALPKPAGFFDPTNPAGLPLDDESEEDLDQAETKTELAEAEEDENSDAQKRPSLLDFANTDIAFFDEVMVAGNYHGFNIYDISTPAEPTLISSVVCPGGQGDITVVDELLIMSVEQTRGRLDCGLEGVAEDVSAERFRGLRIFDISSLEMPRQVGAVQTCRGSHTHSVVSVDEDAIIVYNSGTAPVRDGDELAGCSDESPWKDEQTALFRIDVIEIPIARPSEAQIIHSPAVFADPESGALAGLWARGDHGPRTQTTNETNHCHDITVFPSLQIAAGACSGNGIVFDISDPINPQRIDEVVDAGFAYWHSATLNNDGTKVLYTDEWGGGTRPRCRASDPLTWGANAIYNIVDNELVFGGYFKMPAPQSDKENCVAHNGSLIPVPGRDIMAQAWYQGGLSVFDFTNPADATEIAYFDRGPISEEHLVTGGYWSTYWYNGHIYGTEIVRGVDVFDLQPSKHLSAYEIEAAKMAQMGDLFNPQTQTPVTWPIDSVVAQAYADQLARYQRLTDDDRNELETLLQRVGDAMHDNRGFPELAQPLATWANRARAMMSQSSPEVFRSAQGLANLLEAFSMQTNEKIAQRSVDID